MSKDDAKIAKIVSKKAFFTKNSEILLILRPEVILRLDSESRKKYPSAMFENHYEKSDIKI